MLTQENVAALHEFMDAAGALKGLTGKQARAVCNDLCWVVLLIVTESVDRNIEDLIEARRTPLACSVMTSWVKQDLIRT